MPIDFYNFDLPGTNPTEGAEINAPEAPPSSVNVLDVASQDILADTKMAVRAAQSAGAMYGQYDPTTGAELAAPQERVAPEQLRQEFPGVTGINEALPRSVVENMQTQQQNDAKRADIDSRYEKTWTNLPLRLGVGAVTSMLDPVDDAAFMVPVVGEARYASWLARAGESAGLAGRLGVTAGVGALRGAAGGAILDAARAGMGEDMSLGDVATDALQNALAGGALHSAGSFSSDVLGHRFAESAEGQAATSDADLHDSAVQVAAAQMADDRPVEVRPVFDAAQSSLTDRLRAMQGDLSSSTSLSRGTTPYFDDAIARASGRPTDEMVRADDTAQIAKATPPDAVVAGRLAEAERQIEELRANGALSSEEESVLAEFEPKETAQEGAENAPDREVAPEEPKPRIEPVLASGESGTGYPIGFLTVGPKVPEYRLGAADTAITPTGREVGIRYAAVEADDLTASHDADGNVNPNYPSNLQPRDRERAASLAQIAHIAATLDPRQLTEGYKASDGAPIVSPQGVVESGNGRTLAIRRAYQVHPEAAARYRAALEAQGYDIADMRSPMLVRVRTDAMQDADVEAFAREANTRDTMAYSAVEQAQADARSLADHGLDLYRGGDIDSAGNREFVRTFLTEAVPAAEHGTMIGPDGAISQQAVQRIRAALLAKAYGDADLISGIVESTDSNTKAIGAALTEVAGSWAKMRQAVRDGMIDGSMDITRNLLDAVRLVERARRDGETLRTLISQHDIFSGDTVEPLTEATLRLMFDKDDLTKPVGRDRLAKALQKYAEEAKKSNASPDLLGHSRSATPEDILALARGKYGPEFSQLKLTGANGSAGERAGQPGGDIAGQAGEGVPPAGSGSAAGDAGDVYRDVSTGPASDPVGNSHALSEGRQLVENLKDAAFRRALNREYARQRGVELEPNHKTSTLPALRRLVADLHDDRTTPEEFSRRVEGLLEHLERRRAEKYVSEAQPRARGADYIRERLLQAKRRGEIGDDAADLAEWFIQKNPAMVDDLGISIRNSNENGTAGSYSPVNKVMALFKGSANDTTAVHEMLHHLEQMMPDDIRKGIQDEWSKALAVEVKTGDEKMREYVAAVLLANETRSATALEAARKLLPDASAYQYLNASEFWAVNATRIMADRFDARNSFGARARQWLSELLQKVKGMLGMRSDAAMLRALSDLIRTGTGAASGEMLSDFRSFGDQTDDESKLNAAQLDAATLAKQKLAAMQDMVKRHAMAGKIDEIHAGGLSLAHGFDALTRGISEAVPGARDSTAQHQLAQQEFLMGRLVANLEKIPGGTEAWRSRAVTTEWVRELSELNKQDGKPGITKSPLALQIAKAVHDAQDVARLGLNRAGAWIGDYDGYVARTQHDAVKIHKAEFETWRDDVLGGLDQDKTFGELSPEEREDYLHNTWDALSTGIHMSSDHGVDPKAAAFSGPASMAGKNSAGRVLHWKDADAWMDYQNKYGDPVYERGVMQSLHRAGRDTALMDRWGSNPKLAFDNLIRQVREKYRSDHEGIAQLDKALPRIREEFAHLTGEASRPQSALASQIRGSIMALQDITKLGNVLLAHLSTAVTKPFQLKYLGVGRWKSYTSVLSNLMKDTSPEGRAVLENLRANATGQFQDMIGGYEPIDGVPGQLAKLRSMSMRIGGLPWMLARQKAGTMWELGNFLGQNLGKSFDQLDERTARGLSIYGITPQEWDVLRSAPNPDRDISGSAFLTPTAAMRGNVDGLAGERLSNAANPEDAERIRDEVRNNLAMKLASFYADAAERATVTPGIQERAFITRHFGRTWGPLLGQYKSWAMAAVRTMWGQAIHGSSRAEAVKSLAELVAVGTAIGYARLAITDALNGMTPQQFNGDPTHDVPLIAKSAVAGGGLGIWGDYLMGQYSRAEESSADRAKDVALNVLGPAFSDAARTYGLAERYGSIPFAEDSGDALNKADADATQFMTSHLPLANTYYLRLLSRWLILDRLNEMADPGYLQRHQDAVKQRSGQDFWLPPAQYAGAA